MPGTGIILVTGGGIPADVVRRIQVIPVYAISNLYTAPL